MIERLQAAGVTAQAVSNPLRGIAFDSAYVPSAFAQAPGSVLAVGHSYGGAVTTNAAPDAGNVVDERGAGLEDAAVVGGGGHR